MTVGKKSYKYPADSGKPNESGKFTYTKERQRVPYKGPIPEEKYWINPQEFWENAWWKFSSSQSSWGNYRITIHPYPWSKTYGRGGFFIHGGYERGSAGCIDLTNKMSQFYRDLQKEINGNPNRFIELIVKYQ